MKNSLAVLFLIFTIPVFGQLTVYEQFQKIVTLQQAEEYIKANPELKPALLRLSLGKDSTMIDKRLLRQNQGDVFSVGYVTYRVMEVKDTINYRASYVFLDGASLTPSEIESQKKVIVDKANAGTPFETLSDQYTMDGNETHGDTGWFFGELMMPKEFQDAVSKHKVGEIFFLDDSQKNWHYIIKKTHEDRVKKDIIVLRSNGR